MLGRLREFQPWLMLDDIEDLVSREVQGVKVVESSVFAIVGEASTLGVGARCLLARFLELSA